MLFSKCTKKSVTVEFATFEALVDAVSEDAAAGDQKPTRMTASGLDLGVSWIETRKNPRGEIDSLVIPTLEGAMSMTAADVLIRGVKGELYPCKKDIFEQTYMIGVPEPAAAEDLRPVAANPERPLTYGEAAVGLTFNPSGDPEVYAAKRHFADAIDQMDRLRKRNDLSPETKRLASIAITEMQGAQMWAVKALTWKD